MNRGTTETCGRCGAAMVCNPGPDCWCAALPFRPLPAAPATCLCPRCLAAAPDSAGAGERQRR